MSKINQQTKLNNKLIQICKFIFFILREKFTELYNSSIHQYETIYDKTLLDINDKIHKLTRENTDLMGKIELLEYSIEEYEIKENELKEEQNQLKISYDEIKNENQSKFIYNLINRNTE